MQSEMKKKKIRIFRALKICFLLVAILLLFDSKDVVIKIVRQER